MHEHHYDYSMAGTATATVSDGPLSHSNFHAKRVVSMPRMPIPRAHYQPLFVRTKRAPTPVATKHKKGRSQGSNGFGIHVRNVF